MHKTMSDGNSNYLVIDLPSRNIEVNELTAILPDRSYSVIEPKNFDGAEIVHIFIDLAKITIPALVTYLIAKRNTNTITIKYNDDKISAEIQSTLNNKTLKETQLHKKLDALLNSIIESAEKEQENGTDN